MSGRLRLLVDRPRPDWVDDAECRGMDPAIFYPVTADVALPMAVCRVRP